MQVEPNNDSNAGADGTLSAAAEHEQGQRHDKGYIHTLFRTNPRHAVHHVIGPDQTRCKQSHRDRDTRFFAREVCHTVEKPHPFTRRTVRHTYLRFTSKCRSYARFEAGTFLTTYIHTYFLVLFFATLYRIACYTRKAPTTKSITAPICATRAPASMKRSASSSWFHASTLRAPPWPCAARSMTRVAATAAISR